MDHFCSCLIFCLIAYLKLCAAAALIVINADNGTYSLKTTESNEQPTFKRVSVHPRFATFFKARPIRSD
jgi:hypothetical protein